MSEEEVVNRFLNMIATEYDGNLARQFQNQYILRYKEIEQLQQENKQLKETIDRVISFIKILQNNLKDYTEYEEYTNIFNEMLKDILKILGDKE